MRLAVIAFTKDGIKLAEKLLVVFDQCDGFYASQYNQSEQLIFVEETKLWIEKAFREYDGLIFVSAVGIAVRFIAPFVQDKKSDPAVVVIDDGGKFAVSLLSGHLGGANKLTEELAQLLGAQAVITTATDRKKLWAVDSWAEANQCVLLEYDVAKKISAALLAEKSIGLSTPFTIAALESKQIQPVSAGSLGVVIDFAADAAPFAETLHLIPQIITLGIGCRKGIDSNVLQEAVDQVLRTNNVSPLAVANICSIDLKKNEPAILTLAQKMQKPLFFYTPKELENVKYAFAPIIMVEDKKSFSASAFVTKTTGIDNVCERAAVLGAENGQLLVKKQAVNGVTVALAMRDWQIRIY